MHENLVVIKRQTTLYSRNDAQHNVKKKEPIYFQMIEGEVATVYKMVARTILRQVVL